MLGKLRFTLNRPMGWGGLADLEGLHVVHDGHRRLLYRLDLQARPRTHHLTVLLNLVMQRQDWAQRNVEVIRVYPAGSPEVAAVPRPARFCKNCGQFAGMGEYVSAGVIHPAGVSRAAGQWNRAVRRPLGKAGEDRHELFALPVAGGEFSGRKREDFGLFLEIVLPAVEDSTDVEVLGRLEELTDLEARLRARASRLKLSLTGHILSAIESLVSPGPRLRELQTRLDQCGEMELQSVDKVEPVEEPGLQPGSPVEEYLLVLEETFLWGSSQWNSPEELRHQLERWLQRVGIPAAGVPVEPMDVETGLVSLQEPAPHLVGCVLPGSALKVALAPAAAERLSLRGIGIRASRIGTPVSLYRLAELQPD